MSRFGGLLMGALGDTFTQVGAMHREEDAKTRMMERELEVKQAAEEAKLTREREIKAEEAQALSAAYSSLPAEVQQSPMAVIQHFTAMGQPEMAKTFLDLMEGRAKIAADEALAEQRTTYARNDTRDTDSMIRDRNTIKPPTGLLEFEAYSRMTPEQQEAYRTFNASGSSGGGAATALQKDAQWLVDNGLATNLAEAVERIRSDPSESTVRSLTVQILNDPRNMQMTAEEARQRALAIVAAEQGNPAPAAAPTLDVDALFPRKVK